MEDEEVDSNTKIDTVSGADKSCILVSKEIHKVNSPESSTISPNKEDISDENLVIKLKSASNHESLNTHLVTDNNEDSELTCPAVSCEKKVNGEVGKDESVISEDSTYNCNKIDDCKTDEIVNESEQSNKRKHPPSDASDEFNLSDDESENKTSSGSSPVEFRGFKKRKIFETERERVRFCELDVPDDDEEEKNVVCEPVKPKVPELRRSARNATMAKRKSNEQFIEHKEENGDQLTEYAQYLGLQPTVKFKCGRCGEKHFQSMASLNAHQKICSKVGSNALIKPTKPPGDSNLSTNFRITRKVYLCSACGTYYENWKLFLHMRDMHKRHICLFCLGMFSVADKLAEHLLFKHNVHEKSVKSLEEFLMLFKGSCYLTCCSCEKMFTEREDFFDHQCKDSLLALSNLNKDSVVLASKEISQRCTLCGIKCGHFQTCPNVQNSSTPSTSVNSKNSIISPSNMSLTKFYIPVPPSVQKEWNSKNVNKVSSLRPIVTPEKDDYYDVGNAASFCHVDMANDSEAQSVNKLETDERNPKLETCLRPENHLKSPSESITANREVNKNEDLSKDALPSTEISSSLDERVVEKNENNESKTSQSCDQENIAPINDAVEKISEGDDIMKVDDDDDNENDADDEQNVSEDGDSKMEAGSEKIDDGSSSSENENNKPNESPIFPCYIKLNRLDNKLPDNNTSSGDSSKSDGIDEKKIESDTRQNIPISSDDSDNKNDDVLNSNNDSDSSSNLQTNNSSSNDNDVISSEEQKPLESTSSEMKSSDEICDRVPDIDKDNVNPDDNRLNNPSPPLLAENGFESRDSKDLLDRSDESEDSDKLSVVLSDDGSEDDYGKSKLKDDMMSVDEQDNSNQETNSGHDNANSTENEILKQTDNSNDSNIMPNGNETVDDPRIPESQNSNNNGSLTRKEDSFKIDGEKFQLASEEVLAMALTLEDKMDCLSSQSVIKECVRTSCTTCSYCRHAIKIGVNGRQLALHLLAEHRYMPVKNETVEDVINRLKNSLDELQDTWFNTDSYDSSDQSCFVPYDHTYECFQCNYVTKLHKDLYLHYRKVHQKNILYCCMCKANFSSYSELICHMCPGLYVSKDIQFRCCFCQLDRIPSAFRLMVHLRKSHHTCDICLEIAEDQQKLSTHMWKHKLNHSCYRCGISYRNKPDITKHLFWKHGTESVLCKRCLHKRWPHVYHFCVPPTVFICEECNLSFSKAVYLKVHKRMHSSDLPYACTSCEQKFVSKKLLSKHEKSHYEVPPNNISKVDVLPTPEAPQNISDPSISKPSDASIIPPESTNDVPQETEKPAETPVKQHKKKNKKDKEKKSKPVVDVYDLPPLNLSSESDDSDDEKDAKGPHLSCEENLEKQDKEILATNNLATSTEDNNSEVAPLPVSTEEESMKLKSSNSIAAEPGADNEEIVQPVTVVDGIWDNFHSYKAEQEKRENLDINNKQSVLPESDGNAPIMQKDAFLGDHDYCVSNNVNEAAVDENAGSEKPAREHSSSIDHDYCTLNNTESTNLANQLNQDKMITDTPSKKKQKSPKKKLKQHNSSSSSDSSSDSDSSCSCGDSSCSCSSSSSNSTASSSSTDSDSSSSAGKRHNPSKREKKRDKLKNKRKEDVAKTTEPLPAAEEEPVVDVPVDAEEPLIRESDLETDETSTDEEFYDKYPQRHANQLLAEKRNQLMVLATVASVNNGTASPPVTLASEPVPSPHVNNSPKIEASPPSTPVPIISLPVQPQSKKKGKSKKRKKSQFGRSSTKSQNLSYETPQPSTSFTINHREQIITDSSFSVSSPVLKTPVLNQNVMDNNTFLSNQTPQRLPPSSESHSSKRQSKRRPVRNKFYGYSSEEEDEQHVRRHPPPTKWKKTAAADVHQHNVPPQQPQPQFHHLPQQQQQQQLHIQPQQFQAVQPPLIPDYNFNPKVAVQQPIRTIDDRRDANDRLMKRVSTTGSSSSSDDESESDSERTAINPVIPPPPPPPHTSGLAIASEKDDKLYCYCQCPYDEVSEMIACDGVDCAIEWFHFECVGIMVPPKGKWYCPDCRKRRGLS